LPPPPFFFPLGTSVFFAIHNPFPFASSSPTPPFPVHVLSFQLHFSTRLCVGALLGCVVVA
jgi:hypothetical protein